MWLRIGPVAAEHSNWWGVTTTCLTASRKLLPSGVYVSLAGLHI